VETTSPRLSQEESSSTSKSDRSVNEGALTVSYPSGQVS